MISVFAVLPRDAALPKLKIPALKVTLPVNVFTPLKVNWLGPCFVTVAVPLAMPLKVNTLLFVLLVVKLRLPPSASVPLKVRLLVPV